MNENVPKAEQILRRAKAVGYNGAVLADYKLNILDQVPAHYFTNLAKVKATADSLGITLYPSLAGFGYASGILAHDPNLAEAIPVKDAEFMVRGGQANVEPTELLPNGGFDDARGDTFTGYDFQDAPGKGTFVDRAVLHGGTASFRLENIGSANAPSGNGRITKTVTVAPFRQYHLSVWVKTQDFAAASGVHCTILPADSNGSQSVCYNNWLIKQTQDWTEYHAVFNSLSHTKLRVYMGVWGGTSGKLWFDDTHLTEVGLLNPVRRDTCPVTVQDVASGTAYTEGKDFAPIRDERMGTVPWPGNYEVYHPAPAIKLLPGSAIKDGQRLKVSFSHTVSVYDDQVTCSLTAPKVYDILGQQIDRVQKAMNPAGYFLGYDEIRVAGWDGDSVKSGKSPGEQLADSVRRTSAMVRKANPKATLLFWSDMFDPSHNAHGDYYLLNGSWAGSWEGLPKDAIIVNWNSGKPKESLPFFGKRGHKQILAGYYDGRPDSIRSWLSVAKPADGVIGVMYTTWQSRYNDLEAFAKAAWGGAP